MPAMFDELRDRITSFVLYQLIWTLAN